MQYFLSEINRTDDEIRSTLNSKLRDKRIIFEEMIIRSVRELLNSNNTTLKLEDKQNILNKLTSTRRRRDKERFAKATNALQQSTHSAPMGIGNAAGIALSAASTANEIYYERTEQQILEKSAQESLNAAKFSIYTPQSDNYTIIAKTVARELSFSLQPLLLVLAAGENGIVKLANFMQKSRKKYAIEKLPEYHSTNSVSEIANALVDASIPPVTDNSFYRDFFKIDVYNFDMQLGKHTTLDFDPEVRDLLKLAGLDTEIFFGRLNADPYTIIGALNHSVFLGQNYQLYAGIETRNRIGELLTGTLKYPLRLLAPDKNIGTTGVSFAPRPTGIHLEAAHITLLKKLFPNFSDRNAVIVSAEELAQDKVILPDYSTRKYRSERNSVPWNLKRTADMQKRLNAVLSATINPLSPEDIYSIPDYAKLKAIRDAGDIFDITDSRHDLLDSATKTQEVQIASFGALDKLSQRRLLLTSAKYSKYLAVTTSHYIYCIIKCETSKFADLVLATEILDASRTALNLSRNYPLIEVNYIRKAKNDVRAALTQANEGAILQMQCYENLRILADKFLDKINHHDFLHVIPRLIAWKKKGLANNLSIVRKELNNITDFIGALTNYSFMTESIDELTENEAISLFQDAANLVIEQLYTVNDQDNADKILKKIQICVLEIKVIKYQITNILENPDLKPSNFQEIKRSIDIALNTAISYLDSANNQILSATWLQKKTQKKNLLRELTDILANAKHQRDDADSLLTDLRLQFNNDPDDEETQTFLARIQAYNKYGRLLFITNNQNRDPILKEHLKNLKKTIPEIYRAIEQKITVDLSTYQISIQEYLTVNTTESITTLFTTTNQLKSAKQKMELSFANDAEILSRIHQQARNAVTELQNLIQEILTVNDGVLNIIEECEKTLFDSRTTLEQNCLQKIVKLKSVLESGKISDAEIDPEISNILEIIDKILQSTSYYDNKDLLKESLTTEIISLLNELIQKTSINISEAPIIIKDNPINQPSPISLESKHEEPCISNLWEIWIIVKVFDLTNQQILKNPNGLFTKLKRAEQKVALIQNAIEAEPSELIKARTVAIGKIKQAYQYITYAQKEKSKLTDNISSQPISANILIADNLAWAARPNFNELKYLDEKMESLRKERFEKQQKHKNETIIIDPILIRYLKIGIEYLKKHQETLNKLKSKIKNDLDKIYRLQSPTEKQEAAQSLQNLERRFAKLLNITELKFELTSEKIYHLEKCKTKFTKHILRAYFGYLKLEVDILESETQQPSSDIEQFQKEVPKKRLKNIEQKKVTISAPDNSLLKAAKNYSIADLEKHYNYLSNALKQYLLTSDLKVSNLTDSNSDQGELQISKPKRQSLRLSRTYSDIENGSYSDLLLFSPAHLQSAPADGSKPLITEYKSSRK